MKEDETRATELNHHEATTWTKVYCSALPRGLGQPNTNGAVWAIQSAIRAADCAVLALRERQGRREPGISERESASALADKLGIRRELLATMANEARVDERTVCKELLFIRDGGNRVTGKAGDRVRAMLKRRQLDSRAAIDALRDMIR